MSARLILEVNTGELLPRNDQTAGPLLAVPAVKREAEEEWMIDQRMICSPTVTHSAVKVGGVSVFARLKTGTKNAGQKSNRCDELNRVHTVKGEHSKCSSGDEQLFQLTPQMTKFFRELTAGKLKSKDSQARFCTFRLK